ncbi:hypothetical protein [Streptomyces sp. NPDC126503]|uniref:hypothetical protein n=1 Tax=Streptomyces sp. NPDC126503 TaxID=3155315 RepID=UPI003331FFAD
MSASLQERIDGERMGATLHHWGVLDDLLDHEVAGALHDDSCEEDDSQEGGR